MNQYPIAASSLEKYYHINGKQFERQYKGHLSGYRDWVTKEGTHAERYLIFPENIGPRLSIDETSLSDGELYTIVTNKDAHGGKGAIVSIIAGTKAWEIAEILWLIPSELREQIEEITMDLSPTMRKAARFSFPNAALVADRFHMQKLALDALQELRIRFRWDALDEENRKKAETKATGKTMSLKFLRTVILESSCSPEVDIFSSNLQRSGLSRKKSGLRYSLTIIQTLRQPTT